jgi:hypothetical protein
MDRCEGLLQQLAAEPLALIKQLLDLEERLREAEEKLAEAQT